MKYIFFTIAGLLFGTAALRAQDCEGFYPMNKGNVMELTSYNEKDKLQSVSTTTITDRSSGADGIVLRMHSVVKDEKGKGMVESDFDARCAGGVFYMSMKNMVSSEQLNAWKDMDMKMSGTDLQIPLGAAPGQTLPDGSIQIEVSMNGMKMPGMSIEVTDRKVVAEESVTTPAGTFNCLKISSKVRSKSIFTVEMNSLEWYSKGNGMVRSESYKGDKLKGYTVLTRLVK
jgi:hypothetical protein